MRAEVHGLVCKSYILALHLLGASRHLGAREAQSSGGIPSGALTESDAAPTVRFLTGSVRKDEIRRHEENALGNVDLQVARAREKERETRGERVPRPQARRFRIPRGFIVGKSVFVGVEAAS